MLRPALLASLLLPATVHAETTPTPPAELFESDGQASSWSIGIGLGVRDSPYAGEDLRVRPLPVLTYEGERFFWRGRYGGVHLLEKGPFTLDAVLVARLDGFDIKDDLGRRQLLANGLDPDLMEDRDDGLDAGFALSVHGRAGELELEARTDITDASGGHEVTLDYRYALHWGRTVVVPGVGVSWMSSDLANYYYGTLDAEVARGVPAYRPGSVATPHASIGFSRAIGGKWRAIGALSYEFLPDRISDSPLLDPDTSGVPRLSIAFFRSF